MSQRWCWPAGGESQGPGILGSVDNLLVGGLVPNMAGCGAEVVQGLVSTHYGRPGLLPAQ